MSTGPLRYQSPIDLRNEDVSFHICEYISSKGKRGATFSEEKKIYIPDGDVFLKVKGKKYKLAEYHFHSFPNSSGCKGSEHALNGRKYDAEVHYVFQEVPKGVKNFQCHKDIDICSCNFPKTEGCSETFLVIGRFIKFSNYTIEKNLSKLKIKIPEHYLEYDGSLTAPLEPHQLRTVSDDYAAVRWIVGIKPLDFLESQFTEENTKTTRCLQCLDGRIILEGRRD